MEAQGVHSTKIQSCGSWSASQESHQTSLNTITSACFGIKIAQNIHSNPSLYSSIRAYMTLFAPLSWLSDLRLQ